MKKASFILLSVLKAIGTFILKVLKNPKGRLGVILVGIVMHLFFFFKR